MPEEWSQDAEEDMTEEDTPDNHDSDDDAMEPGE